METTYKLNAQELTPGFVASIQGVYLDRDIEITVRDAEDSHDETEYLCQSPVNRMNISKAIENIERGENLISFENLEQAIQCAKKRNRQA
jgi:hypothetical protein